MLIVNKYIWDWRGDLFVKVGEYVTEDGATFIRWYENR